jgi:hypothetical protein
MLALVAGSHAILAQGKLRKQCVDGRDKPDHGSEKATANDRDAPLFAVLVINASIHRALLVHIRYRGRASASRVADFQRKHSPKPVPVIRPLTIETARRR